MTAEQALEMRATHLRAYVQGVVDLPVTLSHLPGGMEQSLRVCVGQEYLKCTLGEMVCVCVCAHLQGIEEHSPRTYGDPEALHSIVE